MQFNYVGGVADFVFSGLDHSFLLSDVPRTGEVSEGVSHSEQVTDGV